MTKRERRQRYIVYYDVPRWQCMWEVAGAVWLLTPDPVHYLQSSWVSTLGQIILQSNTRATCDTDTMWDSVDQDKWLLHTSSHSALTIYWPQSLHQHSVTWCVSAALVAAAQSWLVIRMITCSRVHVVSQSDDGAASPRHQIRFFRRLLFTRPNNQEESLTCEIFVTRSSQWSRVHLVYSLNSKHKQV